ncbi:ligand-binding sensor domain-containing protein [Runella sp.]|uniref:ligand-binding sensor domain-containing protein n=1 Tax=Runella sp. TaxID=1960881 RepID=UPI003D13A70E
MKKHFLPTHLYPLLLLFVSITSCNPQSKPKSEGVTEPTTVPKGVTGSTIFEANTTAAIDGNIRSIFQDKNGIYWFGTNAAGVYRYDPKQPVGKNLTQFTEKDGLADNQIQSIQEDKAGNIWFGTGRFGVSRYDSKTFTTFTKQESLIVNNDWKLESDDLWFYAGGGVYRYNAHSLAYLPFPKPDFDAKYSPNPPELLSRYAVYCTLKDTKGNLWFGTQANGVCRYDGKTFTWFTEKGLAGPAVLGLFEDKNGNIWFGNNGSGLFRYDGKSLTNFTEEKGLSNREFRASNKPGPGTLARIYSINEDNKGNLWIGTVDAGVWRYDGNSLTNYTTKEGLTSNAVNTIYKDRKGELWFGTDAAGMCKFNGVSFTKFVVR